MIFSFPLADAVLDNELLPSATLAFPQPRTCQMTTTDKAGIVRANFKGHV
jgi:hypothetical protein